MVKKEKKYEKDISGSKKTVNTKNYKRLKKNLSKVEEETVERVQVNGKVKLLNKKTGRKVNLDGKVGKKLLKDSNLPQIGGDRVRNIEFIELKLVDLGNNWLDRKFIRDSEENITLKELSKSVLNKVKNSYKKYLKFTFRGYNAGREAPEFRHIKYTDIKSKNKDKELKNLTDALSSLINYTVYEEESDAFEIGTWIDTSFFSLTYKSDSGASGRNDCKSVATHYFKAISYPSSDDDCLLAILRKKGSQIKTIRKDLGLEGPIKLEDIPLLEKYFKVNIDVYLDEIIETRTTNDSFEKNRTKVNIKYVFAYKSQGKYDETKKVLLKEDHYSLIIKELELVFDKECGERLKVVNGVAKKMKKIEVKRSLERQDRIPKGEIKKKECEYKRKFIFFDIETVFDPNERNLIKPYSVAFFVTEDDKYIDFSEKNIEKYKNKTFWYKGEDCMDDFVEWIENNSNDTRFVLIGYNNSRFDNFPLVKSLINNNIYSSMLYVQNSILQLGFGTRHKCFDLCRFTMCRLKDACKDFNIYPRKVEGFSHELVQEVYNKGGEQALSKWLIKNEKEIVEYNKIDVLATASLFYTVRDAYQKITQADILDYLTLAHLSYECFKNSLISYEEVVDKKTFEVKRKMKKIFDIPPPKSKDEDDYIRGAITGGRCQKFTKTTSINENLRCVDVKSLYPYVMLNRHYPVGEYKRTKKYQENKLGIYSVIIQEQPKIKIAADRSTEILDWDSGNDIVKNITSVELECLKRHGGTFRFEKDEEGYIGIYWEESTTELYKNYFSKIKDEKTKQDILSKTGKDREKLIDKIKDKQKRKELLKTKEEYNPALRNIAKLLLNSLSGKMVQRNFDTKDVMVKNDKEEKNFLGKTKDDVVLLASFGHYRILSGTVKDELVYNKKTAKPSYLGVFIYAHSRTYMYDILYSNYDVLYTDTDSGIITEKDYADFSKKYIKVNGEDVHRYYSLTSKKTDIPTIGGEFGQFEEEFNTAGKKCESYIIAKKIYCVEIKDSKDEIQKESKYRMKGIKLPNFKSSWKGDMLITEKQKTKIMEYDGNDRIKYLFNLKKKLDEKYLEDRNSIDNKTIDIQMFRDLYKNGEITFLCGSIKKSKLLELTQTYIIKTIKLEDDKLVENEEVIEN